MITLQELKAMKAGERIVDKVGNVYVKLKDCPEVGRLDCFQNLESEQVFHAEVLDRAAEKLFKVEVKP